MANDIIEVPAQNIVQLGTLHASTPQALVVGATAIADTLASLIRKKGLSVKIQGREHVRVEGWTVLGALLGVIAREESVVQLDDGGYLATVTLVRMSDGAIVSRASAECGMDEPTWKARPRYARRSMALTRATGKAARLSFSWIMSLAGFDPTPFEEMPPEERKGGAANYDPDTVPSGKNKGRKYVDLTDKELQWYADKGVKPAQEEMAKRLGAAEPRNIGPDAEAVDKLPADAPF